MALTAQFCSGIVSPSAAQRQTDRPDVGREMEGMMAFELVGRDDEPIGVFETHEIARQAAKCRGLCAYEIWSGAVVDDEFQPVLRVEARDDWEPDDPRVREALGYPEEPYDTDRIDDSFHRHEMGC